MNLSNMLAGVGAANRRNWKTIAEADTIGEQQLSWSEAGNSS